MDKSLLSSWYRALRGNALPIIVGIIAALSAYVFLEVADEVAEAEILGVDSGLLLSLRNPDDLADPIGPRWLEEMMRDFTALGGIGVTTLVTAGAVAYLVMIGKRAMAAYVVVTVVGGVALSLALKAGFDRPRPDLAPHGSHVYTQSFPSGHATTAAVVYLTLGAMLARIQPLWRVKALILTMAVALTVAVGFSRVYLAVHWPTDVVAGWALGLAWALGVWLVAMGITRFTRHKHGSEMQKVADQMSS
ncbi:phosphatase PAP2 family protein [Botrimarina mediterranea]|uniref:Undecaprenyl pyrophosphate phosphatase n=1 Tax=Botrimarina mediterranea TaxID=2528022 RepID=A0A518KC15_9BACT|nr:phosphatase PAP2 family protein [Botrimarina mediterranea]QDV75343.1 undecaprenyl pyrophosphate phosphatase [Botrimarina mediterranea]